MKQASEYLLNHEKAEIQKAVADAESHTSAEIVPVLATSSGRYDRAEDLVGLWLGMVLMGLTWWLFQAVPGGGQWGWSAAAFELPALVAAAVAGFIAGALAAVHIGRLRRLFTPHAQMLEEVESRARQVFFDNRVHHTEGATGVLVYVSLYERMAVVLADGAITEKLAPSELQGYCADIVQGMREHRPSESLCSVIRGLGKRLGADFPRAEDDVNELADFLVTIDD